MAGTDRAYLDGLRAVSPLLLGVAPFGLVFGVTVAALPVSSVAGWASSFLIFGGAAQFATFQLLGTGSAALVAIATGLVINARHVMYSAALGPHFRPYGRGWKVLMSYLLTDQVFGITVFRYDRGEDHRYLRRFYLSAGATMWIVWQATTTVGVLAGAVIPESWSLDFAVPLVFLTLLIPALARRADLVAAVVGGGVALAAASLPYGLGLIAGALAGVVAGVASARWETA